MRTLLISRYDWHTRVDGIRDIRVKTQSRATDDEYEHCVGVINKYLDGKVKPVAVIESGCNTAGRLKARVSIPPKAKGEAWRYEEVPADISHVMGAVIETCDDEGNPHDASGNPLRPRLRITFEDASQATVPLGKIKVSSKGKPGEDDEG